MSTIGDSSESAQTVAVYSAPDRITADLLISLLASEGIPAVVGEQVTSMYAGALAVGEGYYGEVRVNAEFEERARAVVAEFVSQQENAQPISDEELEAAAEDTYDPQV